ITGDVPGHLRMLEVLAADPDVLIMSTQTHLYQARIVHQPPPPGPGAHTSPPDLVFPLTEKQRRALEERSRDFLRHGKVILGSAGNYESGGPLRGQYAFATRALAALAPNRASSRESNAGLDEGRRQVLIVGSTGAPAGAPGERETIAAHSYIGEQVG